MFKHILITFLMLLSGGSLMAQEFTSEDLSNIRLVESTLLSGHIIGAEIADSLSKRLPGEYIRELDPRGSLFTAEQVAGIQSMFGAEIPLPDADLRNLLEKSAGLYKERLSFVKTMLSTLGKQDFFRDDSVFFSSARGQHKFANDDQTLQDYWIRMMKAAVLEVSANDSSLSALSDAQINLELNKRFDNQREIALCKLDQLTDGEDDVTTYVLERYMKAFASCFDPHTEYFPMDYVSWFFSALSDETYSSGIFFTEQKGRYVIRELVPYSPVSEFSDEIFIGDEIVSILNNGTKVHPACLPPEVLNEYFTGIIYDSIHLEIQSKRDRQVREFKVAKEKLGSRDNHIYYYLLSNGGNRFGYVDFPAFYSEFTEEGAGSGKDLAYAILKLKRANPRGLILDLRNNGGGSIAEAIDMAGFFVDIGPLFYMEQTGDETNYLVKDTKRGRIFTGKIMLLVNELSASASELVAAAMQKYPDVLVVGTQTFGKSTGQVVVPLVTEGEDLPFGALKITNAKLRGIEGVSYQGDGVRPDIVLPGLYGKKLVGESLEAYALPIGQKDLSARMPGTRLEPIAQLRKSYEKRYAENDLLRSLTEREAKISDLLDNGFYRSLHFRKFSGAADRLLNRKIELDKPYFRAESLETDEEFKVYSRTRKEKLTKDFQLAEAFKIFEDWILLTKQRNE